MDIKIGANVEGTDGKLGSVHRVVVDARSNTVTDLVVKHGALLGHERVVPLSHVTGVDGDVVRLDLDQQGFNVMNGFTAEHFQSPAADFNGPLGYNRGDYLFYGPAFGGVGGVIPAASPIDARGNDQPTPGDQQRPSVGPGTTILDVMGEKIGEVGALELSGDDGKPTRLTMKSGLIFRHEREIPLAWVKEISDDGVMLTMTKDQVEAEGKRE